MENKSGIHPKGHRILIYPEPVEETTASGIVINTGNNIERERLAQLRGVVVEVGSTAWHDQPEAWVKPGDKIIFGKYSGLIYKGDDDLEYRIINDLDIVATVS
jgi:co-chaperonin GroES (HSP10)